MTAPKKADKVRQRELKIKDSNREIFLIKTKLVVTRLQGHYITSSRTEDQVISYVYDAESYPVSCQGHIEWVSNTTTVVDYNIKYQDY